MKLTINGKPVSKEAVELEYQRLLKALRAQLAPKELSRRSHALQRQALDHAISRMLLLNEAQRRAIQTPPEEIDRAVNDVIQACGGASGFQAHLNKLDLSRDTLRRQIQEARQTEKLIEQITASCPQPTEDEVTACLNDHVHEFIGKDTPPESLPPPDTIRKHIRAALAAARKNQELAAFIARLKKDAVIKESETDS